MLLVPRFSNNVVDYLSTFCILISFQANVLHRLKTLEKQRFSDVFWSIEKEHRLERDSGTFSFIRVFFTDTDDSQDSRGRVGTIFYSTLPFPPTHEHWDIYLQLCIWDDYHVFLIATLVFTRLPANVKKLLCYWVRLKTTDNILYRESEENLQLLLPSNLHKLIYEELDSKTG